MPIEKISADAPESKSADIRADNFAKLKALFPDLVTESKDGVAVDVSVLKQLVGDGSVAETEEKFGLNWHGKRKARQLALTPSTGTLRPCPKESEAWDTTQNLMIEGDNLEVLKLLQKSYTGRVNVIYIDPPYNTGKDFVYPDDFQDNIKNYLELTGQIKSGRKMVANTEASGRFHTEWLNMMYPRIKLAQNILHKEGVLLVSIDDNEIQHLLILLNEIFGEDAHVATLVWEKKKKGAFLSGDVTNIKEYIVAVAKSKPDFAGLIGEIASGEETYPVIKTTNTRGRRVIKAGIRSKFKQVNHIEKSGTRISAGNMELILHSDLIIENGILKKDVDLEANWIYSQTLLDQYAKAGELYITQDLYLRRIVTEPRIKKLKDILPMQGKDGETGVRFVDAENLFSDGWGTNEDGFDELHDLLGVQNALSFPKPSKLIAKLIYSATRNIKNAIILDFFAGSGTTAHATYDVNLRAGGDRRFILVQLPEPLSPDNDDQKIAADFCDKLKKPRYLTELTKERIRRASSKCKEELSGSTIDLGFRVYKLDSSNIREWDPKRDDMAATLDEHAEHLKIDRSETDILTELLLKLGLDLCVPIETRTLAETTVYSIGAGALFACLPESITRAQVKPLAQGILAWREELKVAVKSEFVFRDSAFADDVAKTNLAAYIEQNLPDSQRGRIRSL